MPAQVPPLASSARRTSSAPRSRTGSRATAAGKALGEARRQEGRAPHLGLCGRAGGGRRLHAGLAEAGGKLVQTLTVPFPETNWQPLLAQIPSLGVEAVGAFFAGGGAVQFVKDYAAAGLKDQVPAQRLRLPDRRRACGAGRCGRRPQDRAALRRRHRHAAQQRLPRSLQGQGRPRGGRLCGAGLRRGAAAERRPGRDQRRRRGSGRS